MSDGIWPADLPASVAVLAESADQPRDDETGMVDPFAVADEIAVGFDLRRASGQGEDRFLLRSVQVRARNQLVDEGLKRVGIVKAHGDAPAGKRERDDLPSATGACWESAGDGSSLAQRRVIQC
jgi:hypothetical protein